MKYFLVLILFLYSCGNSVSQNKAQNSTKLIGGPCEGCEAVFEYGDRNLNSVDTLPDFNNEGTKIKITGTIYRNDGKTPAEDVILYIYHTDINGIYEKKGDETGWGLRHGYNRGWIKTNKDGKYAFYTIKPGSYPQSNNPAHIHPIILEPDGKYYWIEEFHFEGDPFLTERQINPSSPRGSNGNLELIMKDGILTGTRDIILGKNVPGY